MSVYHDHRLLSSLEEQRTLGDHKCWTMQLYPELGSPEDEMEDTAMQGEDNDDNDDDDDDRRKKKREEEKKEEALMKQPTITYCFCYERFRPPYGDPTWADYAKMRLHIWEEISQRKI